MPEIPLFYHENESKFLKNALEKGVVVISQNYNGYPFLMALTLPGLPYYVFRLYCAQFCIDILFKQQRLGPNYESL